MTTASSSPGPVPSDDLQPIHDVSGAPLPTAPTLRRRRSLPFQLTRFVAFNVRILRMTVKGHHAP